MILRRRSSQEKVSDNIECLSTYIHKIKRDLSLTSGLTTYYTADVAEKLKSGQCQRLKSREIFCRINTS